MRRPNPNKQDYPMMIYHCVNAPKIVKDEAELNKYLGEGWTKHCDVLLGQEAKNAKIAYHKRELLKLDPEAFKPKELPKNEVIKKRSKPK